MKFSDFVKEHFDFICYVWNFVNFRNEGEKNNFIS